MKTVYLAPLRFVLLSIMLCILPLYSTAYAQSGSLLAPNATQKVLSQSSGQIWSDRQVTDLISALEGLAVHGLSPEDYHLTPLKAGNLTPAKRDELATDAWLSAATHMIYGKLDPVSVEPDWTAGKRSVDITAQFAATMRSGYIAGSLDALAPPHPEYKSLQAEYARQRQLAQTETVTKVPEGDLIRPGAKGARVIALQARLLELGLIIAEDATGTYNPATVEAVKGFQDASGLSSDGIVGTSTVRALNRGRQGQIEQLRVNLERWRWLPDYFGKRHLRANIAAFTVTAYEDKKAVRTHLTIVGKPFRKTPVFSDSVDYIVFNPWWETPNSLARRDKLPSFRKDPSAVERLGFDVLDRSGNKVNSSTIDWNSVSAENFPYRLRQRPGEQNALGQVKIMFPNVHNVYLHDTPTRGLFAQRQRAFSSGCLRTQDPIDLSEWLLKDTPNWDRAAIDKAVDSKRETRATLSESVPVHILYMTVVVDEAGVRYLDDLYERDAKVLANLNKPPARIK